jgi:excisionase family DNA binding protein
LYYTTREACDRLRMSRWTLRKRIDEGEITAHKGPARNSRLRIDAASVVAYETRRTISPPVPVLAEAVA